MKILSCFTILFLASFYSAKAQVITDPVQDFLTRMSRKPNDQMLKIVAPVNRNGGNEIFMTYSHSVNGKAGYIWTVYAPVAGGYQRLDSPVVFRTSHFFIGNSKELGGLGLITFASGGAGTGAITGYIFEGTAVQEIDIPNIDLEGKDKALSDMYFSGNHHPAIETTPASQLPQQ
jgi:hypothetical protein